MRFLRFPLLGLATALILSGCGGKLEKSETAQKASQPVNSSSEARYADSAKAEAPTGAEDYSEGDAGGDESVKPAAPREVASIPKRDMSKRDIPDAEPPRSKIAEPEDALEESARETKARQQQIRAGTLTAGSLNDQENLADYREYLSEAQQSSAGRNFPSVRLGERVMIEVKDAQGNGVSDAQVTVTQIGQLQGKNEGVLLDTWTRADGKAFFSTGLDAAHIDNAGSAPFELTVRPPQGKPIIKQVSAGQSPWVVELPEAAGKLPGKLDLALVIDTTGSMGDELNYLKVELDNIAARVQKMFPNVEQRYALICYRDEGDDYVVRNVIDFTGSLPDFRAKLAEQSANGGGDSPEAMHLALENSTKLDWRPKDTARVMFLVADAPPHRPHIERSMNAVSKLRQKGVAVYPLAGSGVMDECEFLMRATAFLTRGQYLFLTDHSGVGNPHAKPHAPKYEVEPLNQLMIRMIASELSGKPVLAKEIIATEESDGSEPPPIPLEQNQTSTETHSEEYHAEHHPASEWAETKFHHQPGRPLWATIWESGTFRVTAAVVLIAVILMVDHRMRT